MGYSSNDSANAFYFTFLPFKEGCGVVMFTALGGCTAMFGYCSGQFLESYVYWTVDHCDT